MGYFLHPQQSQKELGSWWKGREHKTGERKWLGIWVATWSVGSFLKVTESPLEGLSMNLRQERKVKSLSHVPLFVTPWTVAYQAPLSMEFSMQEGSNPCSTLTPAKVSALPWVGSCDVPKETL